MGLHIDEHDYEGVAAEKYTQDLQAPVHSSLGLYCTCSSLFCCASLTRLTQDGDCCPGQRCADDRDDALVCQESTTLPQ